MIAVIGGYGQGLTMRVSRSPEAGETLTGGVLTSDHGGKGSNQAVAARRLGAATVLVSAIGEDAVGRSARELWAAEGVTDRVVSVPGERTMTGFIIVEPSGENRICIADGALAAMRPHHLDGAAAAIASARVALVSLEIPQPVATRALELARAGGALTVLDPAPAAEATVGLLPLVDVVTPNLGELATLAETDELVGRTAVAAACASLRGRGYRGALVVTLGSEGVLVDDAAECTWIPAVPSAAVVDTTGAGDAFAAALAVALAEGAALDDAARFAARAGAFTVAREQVIPALPRRDDLDPIVPSRGAS